MLTQVLFAAHSLSIVNTLTINSEITFSPDDVRRNTNYSLSFNLDYTQLCSQPYGPVRNTAYRLVVFSFWYIGRLMCIVAALKLKYFHCFAGLEFGRPAGELIKLKQPWEKQTTKTHRIAIKPNTDKVARLLIDCRR